LREHLETLFPNKVRQVSVLLQADRLETLVQERQAAIEALERAVALTHASPEKPAPQVKVGRNKCWGGEKVAAIPHYESEIHRLNEEIDKERTGLHDFADSAHHSMTATSSNIFGMRTSLLGGFAGGVVGSQSKRLCKHDWHVGCRSTKGLWPSLWLCVMAAETGFPFEVGVLQFSTRDSRISRSNCCSRLETLTIVRLHNQEDQQGQKRTRMI
jgi:hypothetical protein